MPSMLYVLSFVSLALAFVVGGSMFWYGLKVGEANERLSNPEGNNPNQDCANRSTGPDL